jgi:hypothetical protein
MFQFTGLAATRLCIQRALIRESRDQHSFVNSPGLIADFHALRRLLTPRHPPCALSSLTANIQSSLDKVARNRERLNARAGDADLPARRQDRRCRQPRTREIGRPPLDPTPVAKAEAFAQSSLMSNALLKN